MRIVPESFTLRLGYLRRELESSDPWAQLALQRESFTDDLDGVANSPFTPTALAEVHKTTDRGEGVHADARPERTNSKP